MSYQDVRKVYRDNFRKEFHMIDFDIESFVRKFMTKRTESLLEQTSPNVPTKCTGASTASGCLSSAGQGQLEATM